MEAVIEKEVTVTLKLTEFEAKTLKALIQNPFSDNDPEEVTELRFSIWNALKDISLV